MAKELLSKFNTEKGLEERYKSSMGKGEEAMKSKKWVEAIENFKEALQIKKEDVVAKGKIKEAEEGRKLEESGKKSDELFKIAIKNGDEAMLKKKWNEAIADYGEALKIKQNDQLALVKLEKAKSGKLNQERFEDFMCDRAWVREGQSSTSVCSCSFLRLTDQSLETHAKFVPENLFLIVCHQ